MASQKPPLSGAFVFPEIMSQVAKAKSPRPSRQGQVAKAKSPRVTLGEKYPYDIMILILWNANLDFQRENFIICITGALIK